MCIYVWVFYIFVIVFLKGSLIRWLFWTLCDRKIQEHYLVSFDFDNLIDKKSVHPPIYWKVSFLRQKIKMEPRQIVLMILIFYEFHFRCAKCNTHTYGFKGYVGEQFRVNSVSQIVLKSIVRNLIFLRTDDFWKRIIQPTNFRVRCERLCTLLQI